jgi:hypothetical protein
LWSCGESNLFRFLTDIQMIIADLIQRVSE